MPLALRGEAVTATIHYAWMWPVTCLLTLGIGLLLKAPSRARS